MKPMNLFCLLLVLVFIAVGCEEKLSKPPEATKPKHQAVADGDIEKQKDSLLQPKLTKRIEKYVYKQTPQGELAMYIHFPKDWTANDKRPTIVFFFGGGWRRGKVEQFVPQAEYLVSRGMVTARADYRVKTRHGTTPDKCVEDGKSAVRWLRANATKLGTDPNRIVASGHSCGGHIAACTYTTKGLEAEGEDLTVSCKPNLLVLFEPTFLHCAPTMGLGIGSKMAIKISPYHNLSKEVPPAFLFYGTDDPGLVRGGIDFVEKSKKLGTIVELYTAKGQRHGSFQSFPWLERTIYMVDKFLARYGYTQGEPTMKLPEGKVEMKKMSSINLYTYAEHKWGDTPLHRAALHGNKESVELLIANGADVNAKDKWGWTPLVRAHRYGDKELVELLIANGADVNAKDKWGYTPLLWAIWNQDKDMMKLLIAKGADVNIMPKDDYPPLHYSVLNKYKDMVKLLIDNGAKFNMKDQDGWTAFRCAASRGNRELVEFFVAKGANISSFHIAACVGDLTRVKRFVEQGTNVDVKDELGWTPLYWAASMAQEEVVEFLISKGACIDATTNNKRTPLHQAAGAGAAKLVELLLSKGADLNARDKDNSTPLHVVAEIGHKNIVEFLIAKGADVNAKDNNGKTALSYATENGHTDVVELLRKHRAKE
jgi:ankyrin repeat protein/acetyl esterase/lipase